MDSRHTSIRAAGSLFAWIMFWIINMNLSLVIDAHIKYVSLELEHMVFKELAALLVHLEMEKTLNKELKSTMLCL